MLILVCNNKAESNMITIFTIGSRSNFYFGYKCKGEFILYNL